LRAVRPLSREPDGQVTTTVQQESQLEDVLGSHGRSGQQLEAWEAVYGPVGTDGYPEPLWDKSTGKINHSVADYMRDHGYDLTEYLRRNWLKIGPSLVGKIHVEVGDMDTYYLNLACYDLEKFLNSTTNPYYDGSFKFGRPEKAMDGRQQPRKTWSVSWPGALLPMRPRTRISNNGTTTSTQTQIECG